MKSELEQPVGLPYAPLAVGGAVFIACLLGISTRPPGFIAMVWPANAIMLGLLVRIPCARRATTWLVAAFAYMAADLVAGTDFAKAILLNTANLCGIGAGYVAYRYLPRDALRMREPASALYVILLSAAASVGAGVVGAVGDPFLLQIGMNNAAILWAVTELVNYIALLPVILSAQKFGARLLFVNRVSISTYLRAALPTLALAASCCFAAALGGPGAIALAVPALLWCGLSYSVFVVSVLSFAFSCWSLTILCAAYVQGSGAVVDEHALVSMRLAAFVIALAPTTLAIVMRRMVELNEKLSFTRQSADMAMNAGGIVATWDLNLGLRTLSVEGSFLRMFNLESQPKAIPLEVLSRLMHPDDRDRVWDALGNSIATDTDYHCRYRLVTPQGEIRWFAAFGKPSRDNQHAVSNLTGILVDVTEHAHAVEALEQSNTRFNIVSESIPQIVWSTDSKGRHDYFNSRWAEFTGVSPEETSFDTWERLVHPDDKPRVDESWRACLASGETYSIDYRFRYRDGSYRWLKVLAKPFWNDEGEIVRWYGTSTDINDAKELEAERELVSRELDHRIGNLFALVNGLVALSARHGTDLKSATDDLRGRLSALHGAHVLIRGNGQGQSATLAELLWQLLAPYHNGGDHITIAGDEVAVDASAMTSVALIFHELATNAVKYGALGDSTGHLSIMLTHNGERVRIVWEEVSGAQAATAQGSGFGSKLFTSIVEAQLRGTATRSWSPEGLTVDIDVPASSLERNARG
ncbi:PAS domain-containing protein [Devosia sp. 2618]|uniref:PAS domain-containing protein n=1 Tax=Devosia sp. 2618 TaxID=3156454 RepID=UPI003395E542